MDRLNWDATPQDRALIESIVRRAGLLFESLGCEGSSAQIRTEFRMDITACHLNGTPLDLEKLLNASEFDFAHDVVGIRVHLCRQTGTLKNHFLPRCAAQMREYETFNDEYGG